MRGSGSRDVLTHLLHHRIGRNPLCATGIHIGHASDISIPQEI